MSMGEGMCSESEGAISHAHERSFVWVTDSVLLRGGEGLICIEGIFIIVSFCKHRYH